MAPWTSTRAFCMAWVWTTSNDFSKKLNPLPARWGPGKAAGLHLALTRLWRQSDWPTWLAWQAAQLGLAGASGLSVSSLVGPTTNKVFRYRNSMGSVKVHRWPGVTGPACATVLHPCPVHHQPPRSRGTQGLQGREQNQNVHNNTHNACTGGTAEISAQPRAVLIQGQVYVAHGNLSPSLALDGVVWYSTTRVPAPLAGLVVVTRSPMVKHWVYHPQPALHCERA